MYALMLGQDPLDEPTATALETQDVQVEGDDWEQLLVNWLAELLGLYEVDSFVPTHITMDACAPPRGAARLRGRQAASGEAVGVAVKAVTYYQMKVDIGADRTDVQVIFDI